MKKLLLSALCMILLSLASYGQVTRINNNNSLDPLGLLNNNLALLESETDQSLWASDGTLAGTIKLSTEITHVGYGSLLNGKYIFGGHTAATGNELFISDGTPGGTKLLADIVPGTGNSEPADDFIVLNGFMYFTATTPATGRELWRTNGTTAGTTMVKDIFAGSTGSNETDDYQLAVQGNYVLLAASGSAASGVELWRTDGTNAGTILLKEINPGAPASNPRLFQNFKNMTLFAATNGATGEEIWKTDGTVAGTVILKDINPGAQSSTFVNIELAPGIFYPVNVFYSFHEFNNLAFFTAVDANGAGGIWRTDGTELNTVLVKEMTPNAASLQNIFYLMFDAFNLPGKFIFPYVEVDTKGELWESDGTAAGTKLFKTFPLSDDNNFPVVYVNYGYNAATQTLSYPLYNGKFFFTAETANGYELWSTDGTVANTLLVRDINPSGDGIDGSNGSYLYTTSGLYFAGNNGVHGNELWRTDGSSAGTSMVQDIFLNAEDSEPVLYFIVNGKILFTATDGDDENNRDLFVVNGTFIPLPVQLLDFIALINGNDAHLNWSTATESNSSHFIIQSSYDANNWTDIAKVNAAGNSVTKRDYSYLDPGVMNRGKEIIYYRLVSTDINGHTSNSKIISLKLNATNWNVQLVTNPVVARPELIFSGTEGNTKISIKDLNGKTIYDQVIRRPEGKYTIPVNLKRGAYILFVADKTHKKSLKIIKE